MEQMVTVIIWAAIFQGLFLGFMYLTSKQSGSASNKLLGLFLLSLVAEALAIFVPFDSIIGYSIRQYFELPEIKVLMPLFFLHYVLLKIGFAEKYRKFLRFNYGIAAIIVLITVANVFIYLLTNRSIFDLLSYGTIEIIFLAQQTYAFILSAVCLSIAIIETTKYQHLVRDNYADMELLSISWLWRFIAILVISTLLWGAELSRIFIGFYTGEFTNWNFVNITWAVVTIFIYVVSYQAFKHRDLFDGVNPKPDIRIKPDLTPEKVDKQLEAPLRKCMEQEKLFLKTDLTIYDLAKQINSSTRKVSNCIRVCFGTNFSEWVNTYRVEEVQRQFENEASANLTIEGIGQESGFKSRSAMYAAFKRFTGHSPAHFRKTDLS